MITEVLSSKQTWTNRDDTLCKRLDALSAQDSEFWSFKKDDTREHVHAYFQYPAMMVPQMQAALIREVQHVSTINSIYDPFMGSGTILGEAMRLGLDFGGCDINPLSVLICKTKIGPFDVCNAREKAKDLVDRIKADKSDKVVIHFEQFEKWFRADVASALSKIRRSIQAEDDLNFRRFSWVMLAETIRLTSNSRTDTVKLYAHPEEHTQVRSIKPIETFISVLNRNLNNMFLQQQALNNANLLVNNIYNRDTFLHHGDTRQLSQQTVGSRVFDLLVTSPPYGDNVTTVTYGQHSYLPLQWIPLEDIEQSVDSKWLKSTHEIDSRSLGGHRKNAHQQTTAMKDKSSTLAKLYDELFGGSIKDKEGASRAMAFCRDLDECIDPMLSLLGSNSYIIMTLGNRSIRQRTMQLDMILTELLASRKVSKVHQIPRSITNKRQANRNKLSKTMSKETILLFRKGND